MPRLIPTFVLCVLAAPAHGQTAELPRLGTRVWVRTSATDRPLDAGVKGTFDGIQGDSLRIRLTPDGPVVAMPADSLHQIFVSTGMRSSAGHYAAVAGGLGAVAGALIGFIAGKDCTAAEWICFGRGATAAAGAIGLGGVGLIGGALVGAARPHETWGYAGSGGAVHPVMLPSSAGVRFGVSVAF